MSEDGVPWYWRLFVDRYQSGGTPLMLAAGLHALKKSLPSAAATKSLGLLLAAPAVPQQITSSRRRAEASKRSRLAAYSGRKL